MKTIPVSIIGITLIAAFWAAPSAQAATAAAEKTGPRMARMDEAKFNDWKARWEKNIVNDAKNRYCDKEMGEEIGWLVSPFLNGFYHGYMATGDRKWIDLLIDCGPTRYGTDSTIVAVNDAGWEVIREGVLDERAIKRLLHQTLLFVCSGNTCRSPIAASLARRMLAQRLGCGVGDLRKHGFEVLSAGLHASEGQRASPEAIEAAKEHGADISRHRTRKLTAELINASDMIFCMEDFQIAEVRRLAASTAGKVQRLEELGEIPDPVGAGSDAYRKTAERIEAALAAQLDKELGL